MCPEETESPPNAIAQAVPTPTPASDSIDSPTDSATAPASTATPAQIIQTPPITLAASPYTDPEGTRPGEELMDEKKDDTQEKPEEKPEEKTEDKPESKTEETPEQAPPPPPPPPPRRETQDDRRNDYDYPYQQDYKQTGFLGVPTTGLPYPFFLHNNFLMLFIIIGMVFVLVGAILSGGGTIANNNSNLYGASVITVSCGLFTIATFLMLAGLFRNDLNHLIRFGLLITAAVAIFGVILYSSVGSPVPV